MTDLATTTLLAAFSSPSRGVWHLGPIPIRAYALFILAGIIAALVIGDRRWAARGGERGVIYDIALWPVLFGFVGGRLYHVMTDWRTYFGEGGAGLAAAFKVWDGGLGIWGAVALGGVGAWIACRRRGIPLPAFGDAIAPGIILAQAIGRLGNYFNQELYGRATTLPWGLKVFYRQDPSGIISPNSLEGVSTGQVWAIVHPTFLYELLWNLLVFAMLLYVDRRFTFGHGRLFALYVAGYCVGRFWVELLRDDKASLIDGIRINSFTSTLVFIGAVVYIMAAPKGREDPATLRGNQEEEPLAQVLEKELAAAAATTGVMAAVIVAGREDHPADAVDDDATESADEPEAVLDAPAPGTDADDLDDAGPDEEILEAQVAAAGLEIETVADAENAESLSEDDDDEDADDLEGTDQASPSNGPVSEQQEELTGSDDEEEDEPADIDPEFGSEDEAADEATIAAMVDVIGEAEAEPDAQADPPEPEPSEPQATGRSALGRLLGRRRS